MAHSNNGGGGPAGALGDLYTRCVQMVNENKVSSKNAFDLGLIDKMDDIVAGFMGHGRKNSAGAEAELRFHEASCTIEASSKIYACRVDAVHTETYKVLGGLSAVGNEDEEDGDKDAPAKRRRVVGGTNTLEKNEANIRISGIEADQQSDPYFRRMTALFDAGGAKGLLLTHLPLSNDLSLVFNGDLQVKPPKVEMEKPHKLSGDVLWKDFLGYENTSVSQELLGSRICSPLDVFKKEVWGKVPRYTLPQGLSSIKALVPIDAHEETKAVGEADSQIQEFMPPEDAPVEDDVPSDAGSDGVPADADMCHFDDAAGTLAVSDPVEKDKTDTAAFDKLFEAFGDDNNQFAYFNECWSKGVKREKLADASTQQDLVEPLGQLEPIGQIHEEKSQLKPEKEKVVKRPLFSLLNSEDFPREIETEPCHKHMLNEKSSVWQLNKDVPPYMIDRITMPNWPMCSKYDFVCLGLRPHLMLKLVSKPPPEGDGPHGFKELFTTVVVERPDAFPWLPKGRASMYEPEADNINLDTDANDPAADDFNEDGDLMGDDGAMPSHLDADPQDLFLRPEDDVINALGADGIDAGGLSYGFAGAGFDLCERPQTVDNVDIGYSRNSKYVNVKLVKKHLWDVISGEEAQQQKENKKKKSLSPAKPEKGPQSFQQLISGTMNRMPESETSNLSVAVCFVCQLHLCNEKNLELEVVEPMKNFQVRMPS